MSNDTKLLTMLIVFISLLNITQGFLDSDFQHQGIQATQINTLTTSDISSRRHKVDFNLTAESTEDTVNSNFTLWTVSANLLRMCFTMREQIILRSASVSDGHTTASRMLPSGNRRRSDFSFQKFLNSSACRYNSKSWKNSEIQHKNKCTTSQPLFLHTRKVKDMHSWFTSYWTMQTQPLDG